MALNQSRRLRPDDMETDREAVVGIQSIANYKPFNPAYSAQALLELSEARDKAQLAEIHTQQALTTARNVANAAEWALHNAVIGARKQVIAQFGDDSNEVQAIGLKKASDRKRRARTSRTTPPTSE